MSKSINLLVVEDNKSKIESIEELVNDLTPTVKVTYVLTPSEAIKNLRKINYDFLILDMSLPAYSEETHSIGSLSGKQILQTMKHKRISVPTVILTQWDVFGHHDNTISLDILTSELMQNFSGFLLDVIFWDSSSDLWKKDISSYIIGSTND
ncbi:response regulator [Vibrio splendidus]|uniref:response regulator n=1 Tax=Vibrio splendidus TaxID=29497 RepID=UPI002469A01C|nr:response regulator [Vibrio splendidus]MDH5930943.1 response regulator [Vibrio splendidus]